MAVGEIGLDSLSGTCAHKEPSKAAYFEAQLSLAAEALTSPVIIHTRDATARYTLDILSRHIRHVGVVHCFSGSAETAKELVRTGVAHWIYRGGDL